MNSSPVKSKAFIRMCSRRKRNVSDLPYAAPPLSCAAFFVKVQNGFAAASAAERKRGREKANNIENKKSLPAMQSFFYICEYLGVTPQEFFDEGNACPQTLQEFMTEAKKLDSKSMEYILGIMKELNSKR